MAVSATKIYSLSFAAYNKPVTQDQLEVFEAKSSLAEVADALLDSAALGTQYEGLEGEDFVTAVTRMFARDTGDTTNISRERQQVTIDYFTAELAKEGVDKADVLALMTESLMRSTDGQWEISRDIVANDVADITGETPTNPGNEEYLTAKADRITGTDGDDKFIAYPEATDFGTIANSLQTGDRIDGGAGTDTLEATIQTDYTSGSSARAITPITSNVEKIFLDADSEDGTSTGGDNTTTGNELRLNADNMKNIEQIWSNGSEQSLRVENLHTSTNAPNTEDVTIGMRETGNRGSEGDRDEADFEVYFDERDLIAGQAAGQEGLVFQMLDQTAYDNGENPLTDFALDKISFVVDGTTYSLSFDNAIEDTPDTYEGLVSALNALLSSKYPELAQQGLKFGLGGEFTDPDNRVGTNITLTIPDEDEANQRLAFPNNDTPYTSVEFGSSPSNNIYRQASELDPEAPTGLPITASVILDEVGRGSDGGYLRVGSMSEGSTASKGIEVYDIEVQGDSSLSGLYTTNDKLTTVRIASDAGHSGDLAIGNKWTLSNNANVNGSETGVSESGIQLIDATGFMGNLSLGTEAARFQEVKTLNASINGDVKFYANVSEDNVATTYTTGAGNDVVDVDLDTDAIDAVGAALDINTGSGNDTIALRGDVDGDASQQTMADLNSVALNSGAGDDTVLVEGDVRTDITAGAGSDFIELSSEGLTGETTANHGTWTIGRHSASDTVAEDLPHLADRVLYKAQLTVTFAGFESTVTVDTDAAGNYIATQEDINAAIEAAIAQNPELARLLDVSKGDGDQQITITSNVDGENDLGINLVQPTVVASGTTATTGQVSLAAGDFSALAQGLINTGVVADSSTVDTEAGVVTTMDTIDGELQEDGTVSPGAGDIYYNFNAGGSADATDTVNYSVVNAGAGSNDLVSFNSNDNSANVLEIDQTFGKVSVVNFHNDSPNDVTTAAQVGLHAIDFTAYLDNDIDPSNNGTNSQSQRDIAVSLNITMQRFGDSTAGNSTALANSVNMLIFDESATANGGSFADLTAAKLVAALNGTDGTTNTGGLTGTTLDAAASTATLVGNVQKHIVMVENDDNPGEYKVFSLTSTVDTTSGTTDGEFDTTSATLLGTLDFGASINFNLVGSQEWKDLIEGTDTTAGLYAQADGATAPTTPDTDFTVQEYKDETDAPTTYTITDGLGAVVTEATTDNDGSAVLANADSITVELGAGNEEVTLTNLTDTADASAIDFVGDAATLTTTELSTITDSLSLTAADAITVTGVAGAAVVSVDAALSDNDTITVADDATVSLTATQLSNLKATLAATTPGAGTDATLTVNTLNGATVTATDLADTFDFSDGDTGVAISSFATGTDKVDLNDATTAANVTTISSSAQGTMADNTIYYLNTGNAGDADGATAAASAMSAALSDDADIATGSYVVVVDDNSSAIYQVSNSAADADGIVAGDLTLVGTLDTTVADTDIVLA